MNRKLFSCASALESKGALPKGQAIKEMSREQIRFPCPICDAKGTKCACFDGQAFMGVED